MKFKALARAVVRYFRPAATSVSPEIDLPAFLSGVSREPVPHWKEGAWPAGAAQQMSGSEMRIASGPHPGRKVTGGLINIDARGKTREQIEAEIIVADRQEVGVFGEFHIARSARAFVERREIEVGIQIKIGFADDGAGRTTAHVAEFVFAQQD